MVLSRFKNTIRNGFKLGKGAHITILAQKQWLPHKQTAASLIHIDFLELWLDGTISGVLFPQGTDFPEHKRKLPDRASSGFRGRAAARRVQSRESPSTRR